MNTTVRAALIACVLAPVPGTQAEDVWDRTGNDDTFEATRVELVPGSSEVHDLEATGGVADEDFFRIDQKAFSSYEVVVDGITPGLGVPLLPLGVYLWNWVDELTATSVAAGVGTARTLTFINYNFSSNGQQRIRVTSSFCGSACGATDQYRIRLRDTTYSVPRFNNSGTQVTVLIVHNTSARAVHTQPYFFDAAGTMVGGPPPFDLPPQGTWVLNTSTVPGAGGKSGAIVVMNDGSYGALTGKAVALEPSTGFTFDTAMVPRLE